jgi:glutathione S-transferase
MQRDRVSRIRDQGSETGQRRHCTPAARANGVQLKDDGNVMYTLYLGNKNYSSWSLHAGCSEAFGRHSRNDGSLAGTRARHSGVLASARVPCLHDGDIVVWDSLAIAEYLAERHPGMWPGGSPAGAPGICAEMHSGFCTLAEMTMCIRERVDVRPWSWVRDNIAR